jgi:hypothetical protein
MAYCPHCGKWNNFWAQCCAWCERTIYQIIGRI